MSCYEWFFFYFCDVSEALVQTMGPNVWLCILAYLQCLICFAAPHMTLKRVSFYRLLRRQISLDICKIKMFYLRKHFHNYIIQRLLTRRPLSQLARVWVYPLQRCMRVKTHIFGLNLFVFKLQSNWLVKTSIADKNYRFPDESVACLNHNTRTRHCENGAIESLTMVRFFFKFRHSAEENLVYYFWLASFPIRHSPECIAVRVDTKKYTGPENKSVIYDRSLRTDNRTMSAIGHRGHA